jgi:hypothetical protein
MARPAVLYYALSSQIFCVTVFLLISRRNFDAGLPSGPRDLAPLLLRLAHAWLNFGSGPAWPAHPAYYTVAVAQGPSLLQAVKF